MTFDATDLAAEMLSRATSVTGAAFDTLAMEDQDPGYQLYIDGRFISKHDKRTGYFGQKELTALYPRDWESERSRPSPLSLADESTGEGLVFTLLRDPLGVMEVG